MPHLPFDNQLEDNNVPTSVEPSSIQNEQVQEQPPAGTIAGLLKRGVNKPKQEKAQFDLGGFLQSEGFQFVNKDEQGNTIVKDIKTGDVGTFDVTGVLKQLGADPKNTNVLYNDPKNPVNISPISISDRAKLAVGNVKGSINYLRNKFDQVSVDADNGLLVQKGGVWYTVDPKGLGDGSAWDMAKELSKDVGDLVDLGINAATVTGALAAAGTGVGIPASAAVAAGGGAASGAVRTSLGRYFGTYDTTPDEEIKDIALESVLSAGGQFIAAGARPTLEALSKAASKISRAAIKEPVIGLYGNVTGVGTGAMRELVENTPGVTSAMKSALRKVGPGANADQAINLAKDQAIKAADELFMESETALSRKYGNLLEEVFSGAEQAKMSVSMPDVIVHAGQRIEDAGLGKFIKVGAKGKELTGPVKPDSLGSIKFRPLSEAERVARIQAGLDAPVLDDAAVRQIQLLTKELDSFGKAGELKGRVAANRLQALNKRLNALSRKSFEGGASQEYKAAIAEANTGVRNALKSEFKKVGLEDKYVQMQSLYGEFENSVSTARKLRQADGGVERFVNRIVNENTANRTQIGMAKQLVELTGPKGQELFKKISEHSAASKFLKWAPKMGLLQTGSVLTGNIGLASQFSPRVVAAQVRAMRHLGNTLDFMKILGPKRIDQLTGNPEVFNTLIRTSIVNSQMEREVEDQLLKSIGVNNGQ